MPFCKKYNVATRLLATAMVLLSNSTLADFSVSEALPELVQGSLVVSGTMDLTLSAKVEEAVAKGIPLEIDFEFRLKRQRSLLWNEHIQSWRIRRQIRYHALSGQYFVSNAAADSNKLENFISLRQALQHMGTLSELSFDVVSLQPDPNAQYVLDARVSLDIESLPAPLRPVAYTSLEWHLNSGWTTWTVKR